MSAGHWGHFGAGASSARRALERNGAVAPEGLARPAGAPWSIGDGFTGSLASAPYRKISHSWDQDLPDSTCSGHIILGVANLRDCERLDEGARIRARDRVAVVIGDGDLVSGVAGDYVAHENSCICVWSAQPKQALMSAESADINWSM